MVVNLLHTPHKPKFSSRFVPSLHVFLSGISNILQTDSLNSLYTQMDNSHACFLRGVCKEGLPTIAGRGCCDGPPAFSLHASIAAAEVQHIAAFGKRDSSVARFSVRAAHNFA